MERYTGPYQTLGYRRVLLNPTDDAPVEAATPTEDIPQVVTSTETTTVVRGGEPAGLLSANLRNIIALAVTLVMCWLAWEGTEQARTALVNAFMLLVGAIWGERAALKQPGRDS